MTLQREVIELKLEEQLEGITQSMYNKSISDCSDKELYYAILRLTKGMLEITEPISGPKKVYYISAEFLIGKLLSNNLINLGIYDKTERYSGKERQEAVQRSKRLSRNRLLVTADLADWQPAFWIPSQHLVCREMELV